MREFGILILLTVSISSFAEDNRLQRNYIVAVNDPDTSRLMTRKAVKSYAEYLQEERHKAFAQSETGSWAWVGSRTSPAYAKLNALAKCQSHNQEHEETSPCKVINVDGEWLEGEAKPSRLK